MNDGRGRFITFEGGEGVGKSLVSSRVASYLRAQHGIDCDTSREPGGTGLAQRVRELFSDQDSDEAWTMVAEACLVSAARAQHVQYRIMPNLKSGRWVLCDRFADSTRVYQGILGGVRTGFLEDLIKESTFGLQPDLSFVLDCEVEVSQNRLRQRSSSGAARYDGADLDWHRKLRAAYLDLVDRDPHRFVVIDASQPVEEVEQQVLAVIMQRFPEI